MAGTFWRHSLWIKIGVRLNLIPAPLIDTQFAFVKARAIMVATEIGLFEALGKQNNTLTVLSTMIQADLKNTKALLDVLVAIGYVKLHKDHYSLQKRYQRWLLKESPHDLSVKLRFQNLEWNWLDHLSDYVKTGNTVQVHSQMNSTAWRAYQEAMRPISLPLAAEFAKSIQVPVAAKTVLDIGGGLGMFSIALCQQNPQLHSTILELPPACAYLNTVTLPSGVAHQISYMEGDIRTFDFGEKRYDLVLLMNTLHHFSEEENKNILMKVSKILTFGGSCFIGEVMHCPSRRDPNLALANLYFGMLSGSGLWTKNQIQHWCTQAELSVIPLAGSFNPIGWKIIQGMKK